MTWTKSLASKGAQRHKTSEKELDNMRALIARDLADSAIADFSADRQTGDSRLLTMAHSRRRIWPLLVQVSDRTQS